MRHPGFWVEFLASVVIFYTCLGNSENHQTEYYLLTNWLVCILVFFQEFFQGGQNLLLCKFFGMLIFLLFSDQIFLGGAEVSEGANCLRGALPPFGRKPVSIRIQSPRPDMMPDRSTPWQIQNLKKQQISE